MRLLTLSELLQPQHQSARDSYAMGLSPVAPIAGDCFPQPDGWRDNPQENIYIKVGGRGVTRDEISVPRVISGLEAVTSKRSACANRVTL